MTWVQVQLQPRWLVLSRRREARISRSSDDMMEITQSRYRGHRFPSEVIAYGVWLCFRFPLSLRMVEDLLAVRGIMVSHETIRRWAEKFGRYFANSIRRRTPQSGDKWHLDEGAPRTYASRSESPRS
jgi:transposase-like protein